MKIMEAVAQEDIAAITSINLGHRSIANYQHRPSTSENPTRKNLVNKFGD